MENLNLCKICRTNIIKLISNEAKIKESSENTFKCSFCLGLLYDEELHEQITIESLKKILDEKYDGNTFILAINMPITQLLRETILQKLYSFGRWAPGSMSPKELISRCLMEKISKKTGLRPTLNSNLILTVSFENDEFLDNDFNFVFSNFPNEFSNSAKRKRHKSIVENFDKNQTNGISQLLTKVKIRSLSSQITNEMAKNYKMLSPSKRCKFSVSLERDPIFIAGRYCKFSRNLPQSAWGGSDGENGQNGDSVGERISVVFVKHFGATSSRFTPSGREDVDVRMLGTGRPFVVQLLNARRISSLNDEQSTKTLQELANQINSDPIKKVFVNSLAKVNAKQALILNVGLEEKRKVYSALCYSKIPLKKDCLEKLSSKCPIEILQKTAIRVLKRRPLLDRQRTIFWMKAQQLDSFHFLLKLQTQAGTYVKEFVHSDFGRTRPSLAELMNLDLGVIDILRLDVLSVELEWPPPSNT